jgi:threonine synthase
MKNTLRKELRKQGVGDTIFTQARNLEKKLDIRNLYLKFEGGNPTGTMKDRASFSCLRNAVEKGYQRVAIASCGNFGASIVYFSKVLGLEAHVYIPEKFHSPRVPEIKKMGGILHRVKGTYEDSVDASTSQAADRGWYNANPGTPENTEASLEAYSIIAYEIYERLKHVPEVVSVPVGNGTTLAGIYHGWKKLLEKGITNKVPSMVAASTTGGNPIVESYKNGIKTIIDLNPDKIRETEHNEPLINWKSLDGQIAIEAIYESNGWAVYVTDEEMIEYSDLLLTHEGLNVLPASTSSLAAHPHIKKEEKMVMILTSRGF